MLANVGSNSLAMVRTAVGENVLDQVVAELITSNCISLAVITAAHDSTYYRSKACGGGLGGLRRPSRGTGRESHCHQF